STAAAVREVPGAEDRARRRAERALRHTALLFGRKFHPPEGATRLPWSVDPVSGYRFPRVPAAQLRLPVEGADPKYPWQLGRLEELVSLGQGYWLSTTREEEQRYTAEFISLVVDFLASNPVGEGVQWACAMEISLRAANIAQALQMFREAPEVS